MSSKTNVLVLGCGGNAGRNYIKCLRQSRDVGVIVGTDYNPFHLKASGVEGGMLLSKDDHDDDKVRNICGMVEKWGISYIHAQPDAEVGFLARNQDYRFKGLIVELNERVLKLTEDKMRCQNLWQHDLHLPFRAHRFLELSHSLFYQLRGHDDKVWVRLNNGAGSRGALPVTRFEEANAWVEFWVRNKGVLMSDFIVAPYLPGPEYAVQLLYWKGTLIQTLARERVEHFFAAQSVSGQSSTPSIARTVDDPKVVRTARDAVVSVHRNFKDKPHGVYGVDMRASATGILVPTEINYGRFFTTMDFFARLGVNAPEMLLRLHRGESVSPVDVKPDLYWVRGLDQNPVLMESGVDGGVS